MTLNNNNINLVSNLQYTSDVTLGGTGEVVLISAGGNRARITAGASGPVLTHGADHTIRGNGFLTGNIVNHGTVSGDFGNPITIFSQLSGTGLLENVVIDGSVFNGFGVHSPGASTAVVPLDGLYEIAVGGTLEIEIDGTSPGTGYDQLASTGVVELGGTLDVLFPEQNGYIPTVGDQFDIITSLDNAISGTFSVENLPSIGGGRALTWAPIDYSDPGRVRLEIATVNFFAADFDEDGDVDRDDLSKWESDFGGPGSDADGDGDSDGADFFGLAAAVWTRDIDAGGFAGSARADFAIFSHHFRFGRAATKCTAQQTLAEGHVNEPFLSYHWIDSQPNVL